MWLHRIMQEISSITLTIIYHLFCVNKVINKIYLFRSSMLFIHKYNLYTHLYIYTNKKQKFTRSRFKSLLYQECKQLIHMNMEIALEGEFSS